MKLTRYPEVYQLARDAKARMLRHLRYQMPRCEFQKRLVAKERQRPLWKYVYSHDMVKQIVKRLSAKQHFQIIQKMKGDRQ